MTQVPYCVFQKTKICWSTCTTCQSRGENVESKRIPFQMIAVCQVAGECAKGSGQLRPKWTALLPVTCPYCRRLQECKWCSVSDEYSSQFCSISTDITTPSAPSDCSSTGRSSDCTSTAGLVSSTIGGGMHIVCCPPVNPQVNRNLGHIRLYTHTAGNVRCIAGRLRIQKHFKKVPGVIVYFLA
ncbi:uncharacterized protein LOC143757188 [Siphateles boraxobius]|uniref:uncharacterized protein LOC143757188 n=1 Tax=Siphateles boraxobius TaxID=180520 RepID=UPI004062FAC4